MTEAPHTHFLALYDRLAALYPDAMHVAKAMAASTLDPRTATPDAIWRMLWDKPLYANARVDVDKRGVATINDAMKGAWQVTGAGRCGPCRQTRAISARL